MKEFNSLVNIVAKLRSKKGCQWDRAQKIKDLKKYLLEEIYELLDVIDTGNYTKIKEELGDIFLLLVFISQLYKEKNKFTVKEVLRCINKKMVNRHPHVFSSSFKKSNALKKKDDIVKYWVKEKARTNKRKTLKERLPKVAPSLLLAYLLHKEKKYLDRANTIENTIENLKKRVNKLGSKDASKGRIVEILFLLTELAAFKKLDLEITLREEIFKRAHTVKYKDSLI